MNALQTQPVSLGELVTLFAAGGGPRITFEKETLETLRTARRIAARDGSTTVELAHLAEGFRERTRGERARTTSAVESTRHSERVTLPKLGEPLLDVIERAACYAAARGDGCIRATDLRKGLARTAARARRAAAAKTATAA
jgi:hypothetical protein